MGLLSDLKGVFFVSEMKRKEQKGKGYEGISRDMLQDTENLGLGSIGLLAHLFSYPEDWRLRKTELYKRFKKAKRSRIQTIWNELVEENYIVQFRKRKGKKYEYTYHISTVRFSVEKIQQISKREHAEPWNGKKSVMFGNQKCIDPSDLPFKEKHTSQSADPQCAENHPKQAQDLIKESNGLNAESLSRNMLQDVENLSPEAIGLLSHIISYPDNWRLYKTELVKRFAKTGKAVVERAWKELVSAGYIIQFRKRNGKKFDYIYYFDDTVFTQDEIETYAEKEKAEYWDGTVNRTQKKALVSSKLPEKTEEKQESENVTPEKTQGTEKERAKKIDEKMKKTLKGDLPEDLYEVLSLFSEDYAQMYRWIGKILQAKSDVEKKTGFLYLFENQEHALLITSTVSRALTKMKTEEMRKPDNYLYATVKNNLEDKIPIRL